jgi:hypothetical protein
MGQTADNYAEFLEEPEEPKPFRDKRCCPSLSGEPGAAETVDVRVTKVLKASDKALLMVIEGQSYWVPRKGIIDDIKAERAWNQDVEICLWALKLCEVNSYL